MKKSKIFISNISYLYTEIKLFLYFGLLFRSGSLTLDKLQVIFALSTKHIPAMNLLKKNLSVYVFMIILILYYPFSGNSLTILSTPAGGNWNSTVTWQGGQIPGAGDDVVIVGGSTVSTILGIYNQCNSLTIEAGATLINNGLSGATLTVNGSLYQYGTVKNGTAYLTLVIRQHIEFDGTEWSNYKVTMQGAESGNITFGNAQVFTGSLFTVEGTTRQINALS